MSAPPDLAAVREALTHALAAATENHRNGGPSRDLEAGRINAYRHALDLLAEPPGRCKTCGGTGEINIDVGGGYWECPDCGGTGQR